MLPNGDVMSHKLFKKENTVLYDQMVLNFLRNKNGAFFLVTKDDMFIKTVRGAMRAIGLNYDSMLVSNEQENIIKNCQFLLKTYSQVILFVESKINGKNLIYDFRALKNVFSDSLKIICITPEVSEGHASFIAENEVDSIIKPISINNLIQKIAFAIKPANSFFLEIERVKALIGQGKYDEAMPKIDALLLEKPKSSICMLLKGDIFKNIGDYRRAESYYKEAESESKLNLKPLQKLADLYKEMLDSKNYMKYLLVMDRISPLNHLRKIAIGEQYSKDGEEEAANRYFKDAVAIVRNQANDMLASTYMDIGIKLRDIDPEQSLRFMNQALEAKGGDFTREDLWMVNEMGMCLRKKGDWQGAVDAYRKALHIIPDEAGLHYNMGMAYLQGKEHLKAVKEFEKSVAASPGILQESAIIPFNIGMVYVQMKRYDDAERYMLAALDVDPDFEQARTILGKIRPEDGRVG